MSELVNRFPNTTSQTQTLSGPSIPSPQVADNIGKFRPFHWIPNPFHWSPIRWIFPGWLKTVFFVALIILFLAFLYRILRK